MTDQAKNSYLSSLTSLFDTLAKQGTTLYVEKKRREAREKEVAATHQHERELEDLKHLHQSERDAAERRHAVESEASRRLYESERDVLAMKARSKEEWLRYIYQSQQAKGGLIIEPGMWKSQVFGSDRKGPFVLFDTMSLGPSKLPFDPIQFLAEQFKIQTQVYRHFIQTLTIHEGFNSDSHARQFLRREFADDSVVLVYATFSGNRLSFHTLYNGMTAEQLLIIKDENRILTVPKRMHYALLGRFPFSLLRDLALHYNLQQEGEALAESSDQKAYEDSEFLFDLVVNTALQGLIDQFVACQPFLPYLPRTLKLFQEKSARIRQLGLWSDELAEQIELHELKFKELRAKSREEISSPSDTGDTDEPKRKINP